jgi:hypothetical protein
MPTNPPAVTLFEVAKRAIEISDPTDSDPRLGDLLAQFEDADEPVTAIQNVEERVALAVEGVAAVSMAAAAILYLAHRRDDLGDDPDRGPPPSGAGRVDRAPPPNDRARLAGRPRHRRLTRLDARPG